MDGWGIKDLHKCGEEMSKNSSLPSQEQQEQICWMAWTGGEGRGYGGQGVLSRLETPTGTKGGPFIPVGTSNRDKRPLSPPPLARLAVGPGTKATYCPGPKGCRDKWPGTKAYSSSVRPPQVLQASSTHVRRSSPYFSIPMLIIFSGSSFFPKFLFVWSSDWRLVVQTLRISFWNGNLRILKIKFFFGKSRVWTKHLAW